MEKRIVAFDIGDKRIGVAISDPFNEYAMPSETYWRKGKFSEDVKAIVKIAEERGVGTIVCGLPVNFDGSESIQTEKTKKFIEALKGETSIPIVVEDERFTTMEATKVLIEGGVRREKRKESVDAIAASYILDGYLAKIKKEKQTMSMREETSEYEEDGNIVELVDEEGVTHRFEHLDTIVYKDEWYAIFTPELAEDEEVDEEEGQEIAIFHIVGEENDERLEIVEDEQLLDEIFAEFCSQYEYAEDADDAKKLDTDED